MNNFLKNILNKITIGNKKIFGLFRERKSFLGIDIGTFSIKLAEISENKEKDQLDLLVVDEIRIPQNEKIQVTAEKRAEMISELINKTRANSKKAIFSIENSFTNYAIITLPILKSNKILEYIKLNFNDVLPVDFADVHLEWDVLEKKEGDMKVLLIAVDNDIIQRCKEIAKIAKIDFYGYEIEAKALSNSLVDKKEEKIIVILDVRMKNSSLSLVKNKKLIKSSSLEISVDYFNKNFNTNEIGFSQEEEGEMSINNKPLSEDSENIKNKEEKIKKIREIIKDKNKIEKEIWFESKIEKCKEKLKKIDENIKTEKIDIEQILKEIETLNEKAFKKEKKIKLEKKNYDREIRDKINRRDALISNLQKIERNEKKLNVELQKLEEAGESDDVLKLRQKKRSEIRELERERWINENKIEEIEQKIREKDNILKIFSKEKENIKQIKEEVKKLENKIQKKRDQIKTKKAIEEEILLLLKEKEGIKEIKKTNRTEEYEKSIDAYFELFYNRIWLLIIGLESSEKKNFRKIIISGGADFIPDLTKYLQKRINEKFPIVKVEIANPFTNINTDQLLVKPNKSSQFSNAIGAALKGFKE